MSKYQVNVINLNGMPSIYEDVVEVRYLSGNRLRFKQRRERAAGIEIVETTTSLPYIVVETYLPDIFVRPAGM